MKNFVIIFITCAMLLCNFALAINVIPSGSSSGGNFSYITCGQGNADANTLTLLNFDPSGTVYNYGTGSPTAWTQTGTQTTSAKFGPRAFTKTNGTSQSVNHAGGAEVNLGSGDWTIDFWVFYAGSGDWPSGAGLYGNYSANSAGNTFLSWTGTYFDWYNGVNNPHFTPAALPQSGVWNHIAVMKASGTVYFFLNGVVNGTTQADSVDYTTVGNANTFHVGYSPGVGNTIAWVIDEFRISNNARYATTGFTVATSAYAITNPIISDPSTAISTVVGGSDPGICTVNFTGGKYSVAPVCLCTAVIAATSDCRVTLAATTSSVQYRTRTSGAGATNNLYMVCK